MGVTALLLASKVEESHSPLIRDLVDITDNSCSPAEVRRMELRMLSSLGFNLSRPHPLHFLRRNSRAGIAVRRLSLFINKKYLAGRVGVLQHTLAEYLLEMSLPEYSLAHLPPSLLASAALYLSLMLQQAGANLATVWSPTLQYYSTYRAEDILPVVSSLAAVLVRRGQTKLRAVHTKYSSRKFMKVADMAELDGEMVQKLARVRLRDWTRPTNLSLSTTQHLLALKDPVESDQEEIRMRKQYSVSCTSNLDNNIPESKIKKSSNGEPEDELIKPSMKKKKTATSLSSSDKTERLLGGVELR